MAIEPPPQVHEVSDGLFAYIQPDGTWWLNNTGFLVGRDAVTAIDVCGTEARTRALLDTIASRASRPVRTLVNTHAHGDHTHGNSLTQPGAVIVGHHRCRDAILAFGVHNPLIDQLFPGVEWGDLEVAAPTVTFDDRLRIYVDDLAVDLAHLGPAHTDNDIVAWIPDRKVLFAGDLCFNGGHPNNVAGSIAGTIEAMDALDTLGAQTVVPGHGPVCGPEIFAIMRAYMEFVQGLAAGAKASGIGPLDAARQADLGEFAAWTDAERLVGNLHAAMAELDGGRPDLLTAFREMVEYNGGPFHCLA